MAKQQIHKATFHISRHIEIPQNEDGGIEVELRANDAKLGELMITGAHVYFKARNARESKTWDLTTFVELLKNTPSPY